MVSVVCLVTFTMWFLSNKLGNLSSPSFLISWTSFCSQQDPGSSQPSLVPDLSNSNMVSTYSREGVCSMPWTIYIYLLMDTQMRHRALTGRVTATIVWHLWSIRVGFCKQRNRNVHIWGRWISPAAGLTLLCSLGSSLSHSWHWANKALHPSPSAAAGATITPNSSTLPRIPQTQYLTACALVSRDTLVCHNSEMCLGDPFISPAPRPLHLLVSSSALSLPSITHLLAHPP